MKIDVLSVEQTLHVMCKRFCDKVNSFAYQKGPKWTGTDTVGLAKVETDFLYSQGVPKLWKLHRNRIRNSTKYEIIWICWFQVCFNTPHQHNQCTVKHLKSTNSAHIPSFLWQNNMVSLLYGDGSRISKSRNKTKCGFLPILWGKLQRSRQNECGERYPHFLKSGENECGYLSIYRGIHICKSQGKMNVEKFVLGPKWFGTETSWLILVKETLYY